MYSVAVVTVAAVSVNTPLFAHCVTVVSNAVETPSPDELKPYCMKLSLTYLR